MLLRCCAAYTTATRHASTGARVRAGEIDRDALGSLIYSDGAARRRLNAATHPAVTLELVRQLLWHWLRCHWLVVNRLTSCPILLLQYLWPRACAGSAG